MLSTVSRSSAKLALFAITVTGFAFAACGTDSASPPPQGGAGNGATTGGESGNASNVGGDSTGNAGTDNGASGTETTGGAGTMGAGTAGTMSAGSGGTMSAGTGGSNGGSVADASSPSSDASTAPPMHPGQCIYPPRLSERKAPAWPPTQITSPKGLIFRFMNNCPQTLWVQAAGLPNNVVQLDTKMWKEYDLPGINGRISVFENAAPGQAGNYQISFIELNARPNMALNYNISNVDWVGLPVEVNGIGTDKSCGVTACYSPLAHILDGCPPSLLDNTHHICQAPKNYCANAAHAMEPLCTALDAAGAAAIANDPKCKAGGNINTAGTGWKIYGCAGWWGSSPYCCAKVTRGYGDPGNDNTQNCNYYQTPPYSTYSKYAQTVCPMVYSFAYDDWNDQSGFHTCSKGTELDVTFCPGDP
jgi:hypothetical protein